MGKQEDHDELDADCQGSKTESNASLGDRKLFRTGHSTGAATAAVAESEQMGGADSEEEQMRHIRKRNALYSKKKYYKKKKEVERLEGVKVELASSNEHLVVENARLQSLLDEAQREVCLLEPTGSVSESTAIEWNSSSVSTSSNLAAAQFDNGMGTQFGLSNVPIVPAFSSSFLLSEAPNAATAYLLPHSSVHDPLISRMQNLQPSIPQPVNLDPSLPMDAASLLALINATTGGLLPVPSTQLVTENTLLPNQPSQSLEVQMLLGTLAGNNHLTFPLSNFATSLLPTGPLSFQHALLQPPLSSYPGVPTLANLPTNLVQGWQAPVYQTAQFVSVGTNPPLNASSSSLSTAGATVGGAIDHDPMPQMLLERRARNDDSVANDATHNAP